MQYWRKFLCLHQTIGKFEKISSDISIANMFVRMNITAALQKIIFSYPKACRECFLELVFMREEEVGVS